jgi:hypothetical protein
VSKNAYISAGDCIKDLCLYNEETVSTKGAVYASHLRKVYDELRMDVTHKTEIQKFYINRETMSIEIPSNVLLLYGIGYIDKCGVVEPLWYNLKIPQEILFANGHECSCQSCGEEHANCSIIDTVTDNDTTVYINGDPYNRYEIQTSLGFFLLGLKQLEETIFLSGRMRKLN